MVFSIGAHPRAPGTAYRLKALGTSLVVVAATTIGILDVMAAARPRSVALRGASAAGLYAFDRPRAAIVGLGVLALAHGLARRRYLAWWCAATLLLGWELVSVRGHHVRMVLLTAVLIVLVVSRDHTRAIPDRERIRQLAWSVAGLLALLSVWRLVNVVIHGRAGASHVATVALAGALAVLLLAIAAAPPPPAGTTAERLAVRHLADYPDADSLAPFASRLDRSYAFSPAAGAAIGYRVVLGTALAGGDPVGDPAQRQAAMQAFLQLADERGWRPAVLGASTSAVGQWRDLGLRGFVIGDEAVVDPGRFTLSSRRMRNVRQAVARSANAGIGVDIGPPTPELATDLGEVMQEWLGGRKLRGFSMNLDQLLVRRRDVIIVAARPAGGELVAFARFVRCSDGQVLTLDVAPRRRSAPNGTVEHMLTAAIEYAGASGAQEVSLNFAGLRRLLEADHAAAWLARVLVRPLSPLIHVRQLNGFSAKFDPAWRPRSLLMHSWFSLAAVGLAALVAELKANSRPGQARAEVLEPETATDNG